MYGQDHRQSFVPTCALYTNPLSPLPGPYHQQPRTIYPPRGCSIREGSSVIHTSLFFSCKCLGSFHEDLSLIIQQNSLNSFACYGNFCVRKHVMAVICGSVWSVFMIYIKYWLVELRGGGKKEKSTRKICL